MLYYDDGPNDPIIFTGTGRSSRAFCAYCGRTGQCMFMTFTFLDWLPGEWYHKKCLKAAQRDSNWLIASRRRQYEN